MHPRIPLAFLAARAHCWLMVNLSSTSTPRSLSAELLSSSSTPSLYWCMRLFLPRCRTLRLPLLNLIRSKLSNFQFKPLSWVLLWSSCNRCNSSNKNKRKSWKLEVKPLWWEGKILFKYETEAAAFVPIQSLYYSLRFPSWVAMPSIIFCWVSAMFVLDIAPQIQDIEPQQRQPYRLCSYTIHLLAEP